MNASLHVLQVYSEYNWVLCPFKFTKYTSIQIYKQ